VVSGGVVGGFGAPAGPDDAQPGSAYGAQRVWVALSSGACGDVALLGPVTGSAAVVQPSVKCLARAAVGGVSERYGVGLARGAGDRSEAGFGGQLITIVGALQDWADLTDDLGQIEGADAWEVS
jgi:hypothetical protein